MRKNSHDMRWRYRRDGSFRVATAYNKNDGELIGTHSSEVSYQESQLQVVLDSALKTQSKNKSGDNNVNSYYVPKHPASLPQPLITLVPPKNPLLTSVANLILNEEQKSLANLYRWSSESGNMYGVRELNMQGSSIPSFLTDDPMHLIKETDEPLDDNWFDFSESDEVAYACGYIASNYKNEIDDDGNIALFPIPKTISDPGFMMNLATIEPPDGSTHDLNMDPETGTNKTPDRNDTSQLTAQYFFDKCRNMNKHFKRYVTLYDLPDFWQAVKLIIGAMKSSTDPVCIFTTFKAFPKLEPMSLAKVMVKAAMRMIWGPGGVEALLGKILLKNITLSSFKRYERGNAHGVDASNGGFNRMFYGMMNNSVNKERYLQIAEELDMDPRDFEDMLEHYGWRDDDIQKWDIMQYQTYMHQNFFYFINQYKWDSKLDADQVNWLYLMIVLAIIDTTVVSNMGHGVEIFKRILASGLFLTASGGSKTHDMLSHAYAFRQTNTAMQVMRRMEAQEDLDTNTLKLMKQSYDAFMIGTSFVHFSDDFLQCGLREGLPFGQLVNRNAFFSRNSDLSFKVNQRPWESSVGAPHLAAMLDLMEKFPSIFEGVKDIGYSDYRKESMNGVITEFDLVPYADRVKQWYPLTSEINSDDVRYPGRPEGIIVHGISFLRFHFVLETFEDTVYVMPIRGEDELYHKLYLSNVEYKNEAQMLIKLRMYMFYMYKWPKARATFKAIHDHIQTTYLPDMTVLKDDPVLARELPKKLGVNYDEVIAGFPTMEEVVLFFKPKATASVSTQTDVRNIILGSKYRAHTDIVCWDIIRKKDISYNIPGVYARNFGDVHEARDLERRKLAGLVNRKPGPKFDIASKLKNSTTWRGARGPNVR